MSMSHRKNSLSLYATVALSAACASTLQAASYTWVPTAGGTYQWPTTSQDNWGTGVAGLFPNAAGDEANLNINTLGNQTIDLNQNITVGILNYGDSNSSHSMNINTGSGANTLTLQSASPGGQAQITVSGGASAVNNVINANLSVGGSSSLLISGLASSRLRTNGTTTTNGNDIAVQGGVTSNSTWDVYGDLVGTGTVTVNGVGGVNVVGSKSFAGTFVLNGGSSGSSNAGSLTVTSGSIAAASEVIINGAVGGTGIAQLGGSLHAGNNSAAGSNPGQRFTQNKITLNAGTFSDGGQRSNGSWSDVVQDNVAEVDLNTGFSLLFVASGMDSGGTLLNVATLSRDAGATGYLRSSSLATTAKFVAGNGNALLVGGGGAEATTTMSIVPWLGASNTNGSAASPTGFATHTSNGFRALETATEYAGSISAGATANVNTGGVGIASDTTVNALRFSSGSTSNIGSGNTLTVASGGIFFAVNGGGIGVSGDADAGTLDFGSAEGVVWSVSTNTNTIGAAIDGSGGLTKTGIGTLVLTGDNTYTGDTHVSAGTLRVGNGSFESDLGASGDVYVHNNAVLDILSADVINDANALQLLSYGAFNGKANVGDGLIEIVNSLTLGSNVVGAGYYGSTAAYAANPGLQSEITVNDAYFSGNGLVQVVPEPVSMSVLGLLGGVALRRRRYGR